MMIPEPVIGDHRITSRLSDCLHSHSLSWDEHELL